MPKLVPMDRLPENWFRVIFFSSSFLICHEMFEERPSLILLIENEYPVFRDRTGSEPDTIENDPDRLSGFRI